MNVFQAVLFTDFLVGVSDMGSYHCLDATIFCVLNFFGFLVIFQRFLSFQLGDKCFQYSTTTLEYFQHFYHCFIFMQLYYCWHLLNLRGNFEIEYIAPGFKLRILNFEKCFWHFLFFLVAYLIFVLQHQYYMIVFSTCNTCFNQTILLLLALFKLRGNLLFCLR